MLAVLLAAASAAPVPQLAVYSDCHFVVESAGYCPLLMAVGEYNPYCCATRDSPPPGEAPEIGVDCYDMGEMGATPCPIVVTAGREAWCCSLPAADDDDILGFGTPQ